VRGVYDPIPSHFSADLKNMIKNLLQVTPSNRPSCDEILSTPGLLNHITGTLEELDVAPEKVPVIQDLLSTIRCPRNLGQITDRLPKA
jgi:NIMA (never in mitosis gene a)-related kinase